MWMLASLRLAQRGGDFELSDEKNLLLSIESWMVTRDPYNGLL